MANDEKNVTVGAQPGASPSREPNQSAALAPDVEGAMVEQIKGRARAALADAERAAIAEEQRRMAELQARTQFAESQTGGFKVDGTVKVTYLGPDDLFIFGVNDDGETVQARPGETVTISAELRDYCMALPHDHFENA